MIARDDMWISFAYKTKTVFNIVKMITAYRMRDLADKDGNLIGDPLALTNDERDLFDLCINNAAHAVVDELNKLASKREKLFIIENDRLIFRILNRKKYNENVLSSIDGAIFNVLYNYCCYQFYEVINQAEQSEIYKLKLAESQLILHERCFNLRKMI
jgi:hypothetical protein